jgi:uncharacterized linocin/CFP29 family protein
MNDMNGNTENAKFMVNFEHLKDKEKLKEYCGNLSLTLEQYETIDSRIHLTSAREMFKGRKMFQINNIGGGLASQEYKYYTLDEMSKAITSYALEMGKDIVNLNPNTKQLPIMQKSFEIPVRDLLASERSGTPLNTSCIGSAMYQLALEEDIDLLIGWKPDGTNYECEGLQNITSCSTQGGADFGTPANVDTTLIAAFGTQDAVNIDGPFHMILNPTQYNQLFNKYTSTGITAYESALKMLNTEGGGNIGKIFKSNRIVAGTGLLIPAWTNPFIEYLITGDLAHYEIRDPYTQNLKSTIYIVGAPLVYNAKAVCKLTGI